MDLAKRLRREPKLQEVACAAGLSVGQVKDLRIAGRAATSLDQPMGDGENTLGETMVATDLGPPEEAEVSLERETLYRAMVELPKGERSVLELRYGITANHQPQTIDQVVRHLHISRNRVRGLEERGLARLAAQPDVKALRVGV
jgi:DNA-directed RNA polymerase sigma subunit (sigma70/sigma32)